MKIKLFVKNNHYLNKIIEPIYKVIFNLPNKIKIGFRKHPSMLAGELHLFESIFEQCSTIVDIGARYDVDYIRISSGRGIKYFLFEANPQYSAKLSRKLNKYNEDYTVENVACGEREDFCDYYTDAESVLKNTTAVKNSTKKLNQKLRMIRLDNYFESKKISNIDFLKTDIEEYDFFALLGLGSFISKLKYIQFELGIGAPYNESFINNQNYYELLKKDFELYVVRDENNPLWKKQLISSDLVKMNHHLKSVIEIYQGKGVGFNVFGVSKFLETDLSKLTISILDEQLTYDDSFDRI